MFYRVCPVAIAFLLISTITACGPSESVLQTATAQTAQAFQTAVAETLTAEPTDTPKPTSTYTPTVTPTETATITPSPTIFAKQRLWMCLGPLRVRDSTMDMFLSVEQLPTVVLNPIQGRHLSAVQPLIVVRYLSPLTIPDRLTTAAIAYANIRNMLPLT